MAFIGAGWIGLICFLIVFLFIITLLYGYLLNTWIDPETCPKSYGQYGVLPGVIGDIVDECNGLCEFTVPTLADAAIKCDSDSRCQSFYYDGRNMKYIKINSQFISASPGGTYIRQRKIIRNVDSS